MAILAIGSLLAAVASAVPVLGYILTAGVINQIMRLLANQYEQMSAEDRRLFRAVSKFISSGFSLKEFPRGR